MNFRKGNGNTILIFIGRDNIGRLLHNSAVLGTATLQILNTVECPYSNHTVWYNHSN